MFKQRITPLTRLNYWIKSKVGYDNTWLGDVVCEAVGLISWIKLYYLILDPRLGYLIFK